MKEQVKELWKLCFNDADSFVELYFNTLYSNDVNIAFHEGKVITAAMQMLPYPMSYCGHTIMSGYLSGVCTHPAYRGKGLMKRLLEKALHEMREKGYALTTLIPAEPWLFDYYANVGYIRCFDYATLHYRNTNHSDESITLKSINHFSPTAWQYLYHKQVSRPCCVLHTEENFRVIVSDLQLSGGKIHLLYHKESIKGIAMAYPTSNPKALLIGEIAASSNKSRNQLLQAICLQEKVDELKVMLPPAEAPGCPTTSLGMARILRAEPMLQLYAAAHPERQINIKLSDKELPENNGYYHIEQGECRKSERQPAICYKPLSAAELTAMLLLDEQPYMSLMLNI